MRPYGDNQRLSTSNKFDALDYCRTLLGYTTVGASPTKQSEVLDISDTGKTWRQKYLYRRNELTNSPFGDPDKHKEGNSPSLGGFLSRDIDGTFMG